MLSARISSSDAVCRIKLPQHLEEYLEAALPKAAAWVKSSNGRRSRCRDASCAMHGREASTSKPAGRSADITEREVRQLAYSWFLAPDAVQLRMHR